MGVGQVWGPRWGMGAGECRQPEEDREDRVTLVPPPRRPQTAILRGPPAGPAARVLDSPHTAVSSSTASQGQSQGHKCTCSRCTLQWLLVYLQSYANITII